MQIGIDHDEVIRTTITLANNQFCNLEKIQFILSAIRKFKPGGGKILEIGFGQGSIMMPIAALGYGVFGIDIAPRCVAELEKVARRLNLSQNIRVIEGNAESLQEYPELNRKFDVIIASEVLEHVPHPHRVLQGISKILKDDGLLIITIPNGLGPYSLIVDMFGSRFLYPISRCAGGSEHIQKFSLSSFTNLLAQFRLKITEAQNGTFLHFIFKYVPILGSKLVKYDQLLSRKIPHWLASGWYFLVRHE